jgi:MFS family permease
METVLIARRGIDRIRALATQYPGQFWVLFGGMLSSAIGASMVWPFLTIYTRQHFDVPLTTVGLLLSLNAATGLAATFLAGPGADRFGRKGVMILSLSASCLVFAAMRWADRLSLWAVLLGVEGAFEPFFRVGSNAMVADLLPPDRRASAYALLRMSTNLGVAIGPAVGGFVAAVSYAWAFLTAAVAYALFGLLVLFLVGETLPPTVRDAREPASSAGYSPLLRDRTFLVFCGISTLAVVPSALTMVLLPVYAKEQFGVIESQYGFIMATNAAMVVLFQYTVTQVTRRYPHLPVLAVGALFYSLGVGSIALGHGFVAFLTSMIVLTIGELILVPTGTALAANLSPPDMRGRYMGVYGLAWAVAFGVGPVLGGYLNDHLAPVTMWVGGLAFGLAATGGFLLLARAIGEPAERQGGANHPLPG